MKFNADVLFSQTHKIEYVEKSGNKLNPSPDPVPSNLKNLRLGVFFHCFKC